MSAVRERSEVEAAYTWDLADLYADDAEWEADYEAAEDLVADLRAYEGRATESPPTLQATLETYEDAMRVVSNVTAYARMRRDEDTTDQAAQARYARAQTLANDASAAASFLGPEIQSLDRAAVEAYVEETPDLAEYEHFFDDVLRLKPHTRSAEVEEVLAELSEVTGAGGEVYDMLANADMSFPAVEDPDGGETTVTLSNVTTLLKRRDRGFRRRVHETFYDEWATVRNAVGAAYKNSVKADVKHARARHYETAREAALDGSNVPVEVYDTLLETVRDNLDVLHRHAELKAERLGVDELRMWDVYAPLTRGESPDVDYETAKQYVVEAVAPLGEAYQSRLAEGLASRWVDVYETPNKRSGAYSGGTYDSQPYVLLNYQGDVDSMFTLAHELGHSMHSELASEHQPYVYGDYETFVAEVASTVNESLLTAHLLETLEDDVFRRHVLDEYLERFRGTLFRQAMFADFEHRTHRLVEADEPLTPDRLDECYGELKREFYEPAVVDDRIAREWMRIPHFHRAFYVYQYATGLSAAEALAAAIREEGESAAERYRRFLASGSRGYPLDLLEAAGVDMTTADPVQTAIDTYDTSLAEFERLS